MKLLILFGGVSSEHEVSCLSAASVLRNLDRNQYEITAVGITKDGRWRCYPDWDADKIESGAWESEPSLVPAALSPDRETHGLLLLHADGVQTARIDCAFPVLHGVGGEDGTVQGLLELAGIPYVGCGVAASANSMDKSLTKVLVDAAGVRQARYYLALRHDFEQDGAAQAQKAAAAIGAFPVFIKPCSSGSSVGVCKAHDLPELLAGMREAFRWDSKVLVEEFIDGHEVECAVLGNHDPIAGAVGEIAPAQEFYTYDAKYNDKASALFIPAHITEEQIETVRENALRVYAALGCRGLSRVDFFCTHKDGEIILNELNAMPGFTSISMYPKLFEAVGVAYPDLLDRLIALALEEHHG